MIGSRKGGTREKGTTRRSECTRRNLEDKRLSQRAATSYQSREHCAPDARLALITMPCFNDFSKQGNGATSRSYYISRIGVKFSPPLSTWLFEFISRSSSCTWSGSRALSSSPVTRSLPLFVLSSALDTRSFAHFLHFIDSSLSYLTFLFLLSVLSCLLFCNARNKSLSRSREFATCDNQHESRTVGTRVHTLKICIKLRPPLDFKGSFVPCGRTIRQIIDN